MKLIHWLDKHFEEGLSAILLAAATIIIALQIVFRMVGAPLAWTEELARYLFVWLIYISCSYAVRMRAHIQVDLIPIMCKERGQYILHMISDVCFFVFAVIMTYYGAQLMYNAMYVRVQVSPAMGLNMGFVYLSFVLGLGLTSIRLIQDVVLRTREYKAFKAGKVEGGQA